MLNYLKLLLALFIGSLSIASVKQQEWGYRKGIKPNEWSEVSEKCDGLNQSPINIRRFRSVYDSNLNSIRIKRNGKRIGIIGNNIWNMKNDGKGVILTPTTQNYTIQFNHETFRFVQMHFHWRDSEHFINGRAYDAELHLVHQSIIDPPHYTVIGFLFKKSKEFEDNESLQLILNSLNQIKSFNSTIPLSFKLENLVPTVIPNYYTYFGSFTTPDCSEIVDHVVVNDPIFKLTGDQLLSFQELLDKNGDAILTNSRPIQPVNDRVVKRSFNNILHKSHW